MWCENNNNIQMSNNKRHIPHRLGQTIEMTSPRQNKKKLNNCRWDHSNGLCKNEKRKE